MKLARRDIQILTVLTQAQAPLQIDIIARHTKIPPVSLWPILRLMKQDGWVKEGPEFLHWSITEAGTNALKAAQDNPNLKN